MKAVLVQSHEFGLIRKLDFYWVSPNLIIDRKSKQRMLHFVCYNGDMKKAVILVDRGAKLNVKDVHGNSPLMMSIQGPKMFHPHELIKVPTILLLACIRLLSFLLSSPPVSTIYYQYHV